MDEKTIRDLKNRNIELMDIDIYEKMRLILFLKDFKIPYRDNINLPHKMTFGVEIEYEGTSKDKFDEIIKEEFRV